MAFKTKDQRGRKSRAVAEAELGWVRHLPEVGPRITDRVNAYQATYERYLELKAQAVGMLHDMKAFKRETERQVAEQWSGTERVEARRQQVEEWAREAGQKEVK